MKEGLTNIDIYVLVRELSGIRLSKIVRIPNGYKIKISGGKDLLVLPGRFVIPTSYIVPADRPDTLSILARKRLGNARIISFEQINFDRILRIRTERGSVIIESFGDGNIILTDEENRIIYALHEREWRDREIRRGLEYVPPPPPKIHPDISFDDFSTLFTGKDVVRSLVRSGLPPIYAEEICSLAGVDKNKPASDLSEEDVKALYSAFQDLVSHLQNPEPVVVREGENIVDVLPVPLSRYDNYDLERLPLFSEALDVLTPLLFRTEEESEEKEEKKDIRDLWRRQLEEAKNELETLEKMINEAYAYSSDFLSAIELAKSGKEPPESIGPFKRKKWDGREIVYSFTPQP